MPRRESRTRRARRAEPEAEAPARGEESRPAGRGVWSGSLSFGLVSVPVELYSAQRRSGVPLRMLTADGTPLARQYVCPAEDRSLDREEIVRGVPLGEDEFVVVTEEELEALAPRRSRDIELLRFVKRDTIDPSYFVRGYFLVPGGEQTKAYALLAETMEGSGRAAIATFVMRDKAHALAIFAERGILRAETLRFGDELRSAENVGLPASVEPEKARTRKIAQVIAALAASELAPDELSDDTAERMLALARDKRERDEDGLVAPERPPAAAAEGEAAPGEGGDLVDLMALLKQRLRAAERARPKRAGERKSTRERKGADERKSGRARKRRAS